MYPVHCCEYFLPGFSSFLSSQTDVILSRCVFRFKKNKGFVHCALFASYFPWDQEASSHCIHAKACTQSRIGYGQNKKKWKVMHFQKQPYTLSNCVSLAYWARTPWWCFLLGAQRTTLIWQRLYYECWLTGLKCTVMMFAICQGLLSNHTQYDTNWALCVIKLQDTASRCE